MATVETTRYLVRPDGTEDSPFHDTWSFGLEVVRRNHGIADAPEEWAVSSVSFTQYGFTRTGKQVSLRGVDKLNRRHAVFDLETALQLARDLADGVVTSDYYETHAVAAERLRQFQAAEAAHNEARARRAAAQTEHEAQQSAVNAAVASEDLAPAQTAETAETVSP